MKKRFITAAPALTIAGIPDKVLADMIRQGCYVANTRFTGKYAARYLCVLAVPYGADEAISTMAEALEAFHDLVSADDWKERNFTILTIENGQPQVIEASYENLEADEQEAAR